MKRSGRKSASQTPAPKKDRIKGSSKNPKGSAASKKSAASINLSESITKTLSDKRTKFIKEHPNQSVSLATLKAVMRRGMGAYSTSYRPTITGGAPNSRQAWGFARVNKFLLKKGGTKVKAAYVQDDDLMAKGGTIGQEITCVNCGWNWNTKDSDEFDKYVCHRCGFDNRTFYDSDPIGKYHLGGDMSKHLAPNGKPSNLNHEQWHLVRTPQFKAWFGDWESNPENASKVVDENGEPLVVYHGTYAKEQFNFFDFDKADLGFHFGTYEQAKDRSETKIGVKGYKSIVTPYFLNIREQFNILDVREFEYPPKYLTELIANNVITEKESKENNFDISIYRQDNKKIRDFLKAKYGDNVGFEYENNIEGEGKSFITLHPNQIKLADGSNTTFDAENPDIRYKKGGKTKAKGDCYKAAADFAIGSKFYAPNIDFRGEPYIVHAEVSGQGSIHGLRYGHAWVEDDVFVYDYSNNRQIVFPKNLYYSIGQVNTKNPKKYQKYTFEQARKKMLDTGNYGSWDIETEFDDGGLVRALDVSITNLKKNGIVLTDNDGEVALIAYNTGNQSIKPSLYNKSLIYKSVQPIKSANEIIENFDSGNYERFDADKIDLLKKKHLIIINQNEIIYDNQNSSLVLKIGGIMKNQIALPDSYANYDTLKPILEKQGYSIQKMEKMEKKYNKGGSLSEKMTFLKTQREARKLEGYYNDGGKIGITNCQVLDKNGERKIDLESIEKMTDCLNEQPQTKFMHFDFDKNDYEQDRKKLHRKIIYDFKKDLICVERDEPIAILMGGSPASGKSTFLKKYAPYLLKEEIFRIDADEIRSKLPEYKGYNATQTHLETKDIVNTLLSDRNIGIPCRFDLIYDGTMNNTKSYLPLINILKKDGYKVFIVYIDKVPKDVIVKRALERYKKSGRFVPLEVIDDFFEKGTAALEQLKNSVDGYMIIDGGDTNYKIIERGGKKLPQDRNYSKIGEPIKITTQDVVREFKKGGEIDPDDSSIKDAITHKSGSAGGLLVGKRHSEGGIKAINKSSNQMLEMEGGEVVITRNAVSDDTKREFEGEMLSNREILSRINQSGGGVSFSDGGDVPSSCSCSGKKYNYGGHLKTDYEIVDSINKPRTDDILTNYYEEGGKITINNPIGKGEISIPTLNYFTKKAYVLQQNGIKYIPKYDELYQSVIYYRNGDKRSKKMSTFDAYKFFINQQFAIPFEKLSDSVKKLLIGK